MHDVLVMFSSAGIENVNAETVRKWISRDTIPGERLAQLLALLEIRRGRPVSILSYLL